MLSTAMVASMLSFNLSVSANVDAATTAFTDIDQSYAKAEISKLVDHGILSGYADGTFKPTAPVTRAELAKIMVSALKLTPDAVQAAQFNDVKEGQWYAGYIGALVKSGIAQGTSKDQFSPNKTVTREELAVFFVRAFGWNETKANDQASKTELSDLDQVSEWAKESVLLAYQSGFIKGIRQKDGSVKFNPTGKADRQALARLAYEFVTNKSTYDSVINPVKTEEPTDQPAKETPETQKPADDNNSSKGSAGSKGDSGSAGGSSGNNGNSGNSGNNGNNGGNETSGRNITSPGTYTLGNVTGNVTIGAQNVILKNTTISGNLSVLESVGNGDVTLENVKVSGTTSILGGGPNSIHAVNSVLATVMINKADGSIRLVLEGDSNVEQIELRSGAIVQNASAGEVGTVNLSESMPHNANVALSGTFDSVLVHAEQIAVEFGDQTTIGNLEVFEQALNSTFKINPGATVTHAILNAIVEFSGQGTLSSVLLNVDGIDFSQLAQQPVIQADPAVTSVVYAPESVELSSIGSTRQIVFVGIKDNGNKDITSLANWSVDRNDVVEVQSGKVLAKGNGTATVTGRYGDHNIAVPVTVAVYQENYVSLQSIHVTNGRIQVGFSDDLDASRLTAENFIVSAYVNGNAYNLSNLQYNNGEFTFDAVELYGATLYVTVEADADNTFFAGSQSDSIKLTGFGGHIKDVAGQPVAGLTISFRKGLDAKEGAIVGTVTTDTYGDYYIYLPPGIYTGELGGGETRYITTYLMGVAAVNVNNLNENQTAIEIPAPEETRIVLTWGKDPVDLDSHLVGPGGNGGLFHTYYSDKRYYYNDELMVDLDLDDVTSYGPETTTIRHLLPGTYYFYVHHYSGESTIKMSGAKIEVYQGSVSSPTAQYVVEEGSGNERYWMIFKMTVNEEGAASFETINEFTNNNPWYTLQTSQDSQESQDPQDPIEE